MIEIIMRHGAEYIPEQVEKNIKLNDIVQSLQSAHFKHTPATLEFNKAVNKDDKSQLSEKADNLIANLKSDIYALDYNNSEDKSKIDSLITSKFSDVKKGQGLDFANQILTISGIGEKLQEEIISDPELASKAIESLSLNPLENKEKINNLNTYIKKTINQAIDHYTTIDSKPFGDEYGSAKEFIGVIALKVSEQTEEVKNDTLKLLLIEILDSASMYNSGGPSCLTGAINKFFNAVPHIFNEEKKKNSEFEFEDFKLNKGISIACVADMLYKDGKKDLVDKILGKSELSRIEAQDIASQSYKIFKETKKDDNPDYRFSELVHCGGRNIFTGNDIKVKEFCDTIDYERLSSLIYGQLLKKTENNKFKIHPEVYQTLHFDTEDLKEMRKKDKLEEIMNKTGMSLKDISISATKIQAFARGVAVRNKQANVGQGQ
jgi:cyanate lyase